MIVFISLREHPVFSALISSFTRREFRSIEGKDKLSTDPLTAILASLDYIYGIYGASSCNGRLQNSQPSHFSYC